MQKMHITVEFRTRLPLIQVIETQPVIRNRRAARKVKVRRVVVSDQELGIMMMRIMIKTTILMK